MKHLDDILRTLVLGALLAGMGACFYSDMRAARCNAAIESKNDRAIELVCGGKP